MGNRGSTTNGPHDDEQADGDVADYYALLEVDENATADEIRVRTQRQILHRPHLHIFSGRFVNSLSFITLTKIQVMSRVPRRSSQPYSKPTRYAAPVSIVSISLTGPNDSIRS